MYIFHTNPNEGDTDKDGADDKWELENNYDPNSYDQFFNISANACDESLSVEVSLEASGLQVDSLSVERADDLVFFDNTIPGYIGSPFKFEIAGDFEQATIAFTFDESLLNEDDFVPTIYYFNEETQLFEEMETVVNGNVASTITTHFSVYVLLNKVSYEDAWQTIKTPNYSSSISNINIAFVVDTSGSMSGIKLQTAKNVIQNFVERIRDNEVNTNISLVSFSDKANIVSYLSDDYNTFLHNLKFLSSGGGTAIYKGLNKGLEVLQSTGLNSYNAVILLTDGYDEPSVPYTNYQPYVTAAQSAGVNIYTIGVGTIDEELLLKLADETDGDYFFADNASMLYGIYEEIGNEIIDYTTDSNHDGICDYYTKLLCDGTLRIGTQNDIFSNVSYDDFNSNNDYDGDGIKNGDEFEIKRDLITGRVYVYLNSNPIVRDSDYDGMDDGFDSEPLNSNVGFVIYQSQNDDKEIKSRPHDLRPEDYQYNDKSIDQLRDMKYISWTDFFGQDVLDYKLSWKTMALLMSSGEMETVAWDMINHFMEGNGSDYSNEILTREIVSHKNTETYVNAIFPIVDAYISTYNGNISGLEFNEDERNSSVLIAGVKDNNGNLICPGMVQNGKLEIPEPVYSDYTSGLGVCVDSLNGNRIEITSFSFDGHNYNYTLRFTMYDIYGLDSEDIEGAYKYPIPVGALAGFRSWFFQKTVYPLKK